MIVVHLDRLALYHGAAWDVWKCGSLNLSQP
jgi:hypothetical protein